jgi:hypothetical protein
MLNTQENMIIKRTLEEFTNWVGSNAINTALKQFHELELYIVGGVLRDISLGISLPPKDFDILAIGNDTENFFSYLKDIGTLEYGQFNSPRWFPSSQTACYSDMMNIDSWDTGLNKCTSVEEVLSQFDFTGNAIALGIKDHKLYNPLNGIEDLNNHVLSAIRFDFKDTPIREDAKLTKMALHWFRYFLYSYRLGLQLDQNTTEWVYNNRIYLKQLSFFCDEFGYDSKTVKTAITKSAII